jgi:hypothetical protein
MGFDVYGKNKDAYFRNNVWWWHPLMEYVEEVAPEIFCKIECPHSNDGTGLNAKDSAELADLLAVEVLEGNTKDWEEKYMKEINSLPLIDCRICGGTGYRRQPPDAGPGELKCNGCEGTGKVKPSEANYPFKTENVQKFISFLRECEGFEIW